MSTTFSENLLRGVFIRAARGVLGISLKEVGEQVSVSAGAVGKWENNEAPIKDAIFEDLKRFFLGNGISFDSSNPEQLIIKVDKHAINLVNDSPRHPKYQTLDDMVLAQARNELDALIAKHTPDSQTIEQDPMLKMMAAFMALTGGKLLYIDPNKSENVNEENESTQIESGSSIGSKDTARLLKSLKNNQE